MLVDVRDNKIETAMRILKKRLQQEGLFREVKKRKHFEKPSKLRSLRKNEAIIRYRKLLHKNREMEDFI